MTSIPGGLHGVCARVYAKRLNIPRFVAELSLAETRRIQVVSVVQLYKAFGGGWSPRGAGEPASIPVVSKGSG